MLVLAIVLLTVAKSLHEEPLVALGGVCLFGGGWLVLGAGVLAIWLACWDVCDECGEWQGVVGKGREVLERKKCYGLVTRRSSSESHGAVYGGPKVGTMPSHSYSEHEWQERVPVVRTVYRYHTKCRYCGAEWEQDRVVEVEDFEPDEPLPPTP